jgi:hypothetical protein
MTSDPEPLNYFNYFTEVEDRFQQKRGTWILLSTLDWALIDIWREAGIPLEVVFRGIDMTFEKWEKRRVKTRRINGLAFCVQEVEAAFEEYKEASVGGREKSARVEPEPLFSSDELNAFFHSGLAGIRSAISRLRGQAIEAAADISASAVAAIRDPSALAGDFERIGGALEILALETVEASNAEKLDFENLERRLGAIEEKLLSAIKNAMDDRSLADLEAEAQSALAPYKRNMRADMIANLQKQFINKRLLELWSLPRFSLFHLQ